MNERRTSGIATVMFTDVEASTDITTRLGDDAAAALFGTHDRIVREQVAEFGGRDVRSTGDGFLVVFDSARAAVSCALAIQRALAEQEETVRVRIGLNAGEVVEGGGELFGAAVNLAARVMDRADGREILMTDTVRQLVGTMTDATFRDRGRVTLKGFPERHRLYEVQPTGGGSQRSRPPRRPSRRTLALIGAAALAACVAAAVALVVRESGSSSAISVSANSVAVIDPRIGAVVDAIAVDENPGPVGAGPGVLWVLNLNSETISRIDVRTRRLLGTKGVSEANNLVTSPEEVWIAAGGCSNGGTPGKLLHLFTSADGGIDLSGGDELSLTHVFPGVKSDTVLPLTTPGCGLAAQSTAAWVATNVPPGVARFDYAPVTTQSNLRWARRLPHSPTAIAVGFGSVWIVDSETDVIRRLDQETSRTIDEIADRAGPIAIAADSTAVWVANEDDNSVSRIDPGTNEVSPPIPVGRDPIAIATGDGAVWVAASGDRSVARIDPRTNRVTARIAVGHPPQGIAIAGGLVWVTVRA
jgi:YVTN family beta-propeller protein